MIKPKNQTTWLRDMRNSSVKARRRSRPRWPNCLRWAACTGSSSRLSSFKPSGGVRAITVRRTSGSRHREIRPRFSRRSSRRVTSGSRVIMRLAISPQGSPSGAPRRIRITLYCVAERSSATQYNVLRILRGAPEGLPCGEIASRMITRDPDVTRLLDRLEKRGLISRCRETKDRRTVMARITQEGLKLLTRLDEPVQADHRKQLGHLGRERLRTLTELLRVSCSQVV